MLIVQTIVFFAVLYALYYIGSVIMEEADDYFSPHDEIDDNLPRDKHNPNGG